MTHSLCTVGDHVTQLESWFPLDAAESWDNTGLLLGNRASVVRSVMTCLTVTEESAAEAIREDADLVVSHHPILFKGTQRLTDPGPFAFVYRLARAGIAVYSPHTAFDSADLGINHQIAQRIGLQEVRPLRSHPAESCKIVVFVPVGDLEKVMTSAFDAGAGSIGNYSECSFRLAGIGSFRGNESANPTVGERGRRVSVDEERLEVIAPRRLVAQIVSAIRQAHAYEEPAIDVYPLLPSADAPGSGRWGRAPAPATLGSWCQRIASALAVPGVHWVGNSLDQPCQVIGIACGAGSEFLDDAAARGCDLLITGEARFHQCLEAQSRGMAMVLAGHYATERFSLETLADRIARAFPGVRAWASSQERDPAPWLPANPSSPAAAGDP